jgi:hypothetical protein
MKYISVLVFAVVLAWTWHVIHSSSTISFETQSGIQEKLAALITETIKAKRPSASDIIIEKLWTEVIGDNKVQAHFVYSFKDQSEGGFVTTQIQGDGTLERQPSQNENEDRWALTNVHTSNNAIMFDDALIVTADGKEPSEEAPSANETQEKSEKKAAPESHESQ